MGGRSAFERTEGSAVDGGRKTIVGRNQTEKEKVSRGTPTEEIRRRELVEDSSLESGPGRQTHDEKHERLVREYGIRRGQGGGKSAKSIERSKTRTVLLSIPPSAGSGNPAHAAANDALQKWAMQQGESKVLFVDSSSLVPFARPSPLWMMDGLHMTAAGYAQFGTRLADAIAGFVAPGSGS